MNEEDFDLEIKTLLIIGRFIQRKRKMMKKRWISNHIDISYVRKLWNIL